MDESTLIRNMTHRHHQSEDEMEFIFSNFFNSKYPILLTSEKRWHPPTDVFESEEEYIVIMDVAYVRQEDIQLSYEGGVLRVTGNRREFQVGCKRHYHKMEIDFGPFERRIKINARIVDSSIKACYDNGFLVIRLKKDKARGSKITNIQVE